MDPLQDFLKAEALDDLLPETIINEATSRFGIAHSNVEKAALEIGLLPARYQRNRKTLSVKHQLALFEARVAVIGCGGLGGYVIEELARLGIGTIVAIDPDKFEEHNLNRQILCTVKTLGSPKVAAAAERVKQINPAVTLVPVEQALGPANAALVLYGCDIVVDALDSIPARIELAKYCINQSVHLVHGAIAGWYGQIAVQYAGEETVLSLLNSCRDKAGIEKEVGNPAFAPAFVASLQTAEVCKILTSGERSMSGRIIFIDLKDMKFQEIKTGCPPSALL